MEREELRMGGAGRRCYDKATGAVDSKRSCQCWRPVLQAKELANSWDRKVQRGRVAYR